MWKPPAITIEFSEEPTAKTVVVFLEEIAKQDGISLNKAAELALVGAAEEHFNERRIAMTFNEDATAATVFAFLNSVAKKGGVPINKAAELLLVQAAQDYQLRQKRSEGNQRLIAVILMFILAIIVAMYIVKQLGN